jgi:dTMP kinase
VTPIQAGWQMNHMPFIVFEGLDGSGKTTLIKLLSDQLQTAGFVCRVTREPGGTQLGEQIRNLLLSTEGEAPTPRCELLLYEAIRVQHVEKLIRPATAAGEWVLCDRFAPSTVAFQAGARGLSATDVLWLNKFAVGNVQPDLIVLLDLPVEVCLSRRQKRCQQSGVDQDRFEREQQSFHEAVRQSYLDQARNDTNRWLVLDAQQEPITIFNELISMLEQKGWLES